LNDRSHSSANCLRVRPRRSRHQATLRPISRRRSLPSSIDTVPVLPNFTDDLTPSGRSVRQGSSPQGLPGLEPTYTPVASPDRGTRQFVRRSLDQQPLASAPGPGAGLSPELVRGSSPDASPASTGLAFPVLGAVQGDDQEAWERGGEQGDRPGAG